MDLVFKALADPTRRHLLDQLHERNGQTLSELCERVAMARQSVTQHLALLEDANLISTVKRGREKLHYLNPVPLHEIQQRWIDKFEQPRLDALATVKRRATTMHRPDYVYVTYIEATPEAVWEALTDADITASYWGHRNESTWAVGAPWRHARADGSGDDGGGTVVEADRPHRLVLTWDESTLTFTIEPVGGIVRLTVLHEDLDDATREAVSSGWPAVLSNLKSLLETGHPLSTEPWVA